MSEALTRRDAVRNIQRYLRALSYSKEYSDVLSRRPPADGIFEDTTEAAVRAFQESFGLPSTGRVDKATHDALYGEYQKAESRSDRSAQLVLFPTTPDGYSIGIGERSLTVYVIQALLRELSAAHDIFEELDESFVNGTYDEATAKSIRDYQRLARLPVTGEVDLLTWNYLITDHKNL